MPDKAAFLSSAAVALILSASAASAQSIDQEEKAPPSGQLNDIIVTARKTTENNQKAPASIVAIGNDELIARGITDLQSLEKVLPSANLRRQGAIIQVYIRGIGTRNDLPNFAAASAFNYNGLVIPRYGTVGLTFDLDRIESIAGPQGTLYGGSAAGGAINTYSAAPRNDFSGYARVQYGNYNDLHLDAAQNVPLTDTLSVRGAISFARRDSYYGRDLETGHTLSGRVSMLYQPSSDLTAKVFYSHVKDDGEPNNSLIGNPLTYPDDPYFIPATGSVGNPIDGRFTHQSNRSDIVGTNIDFNIGENAFTLIAGYVDFTSDILKYSGTSGRQLQVFDRERQHSEEFRWNRTFGSLKLSAGLFYLHDLIDFNDGQVIYTGPTTSTYKQANITDQTNESAAVFGQAIYSVTDSLRLTAGGRLSYDRMDATGQGSGAVPIDFHHSHYHTDYKLGVDYDIAPRIMAYANLQSGYIPFGYNPDVAPTPIVPESKLTAYSGGFKSRLLDNTLELNVEGFYYLYKNFQAIQFVNATATSTILNAPKSTIYGIDIGARAQIATNTHFDLGVVLQRARYDELSGVGYDYDGNQLINAPDVKIEAGLQQIFPLGDLGDLTARADTHFESSHYGTFQNDRNALQPAYTRTDLSLTYANPGDRWSIGAFVHNVENSITFTTLSAGSSSLDSPRTYGVQLSAKW